jgi:hypothetical protein
MAQSQIQQRFSKLKFTSPEGDVNLVNMMYELRELAPSFRNVRKMLRQIAKIAKVEKRSRWMRIGDLVTNARLEWSFGLGAFVRDIMTLWKTVTKFHDNYHSFLSYMGNAQGTNHLVPTPVPPTLTQEIGTMTFEGCRYDVLFIDEYPEDQNYTCVSARYKYWSNSLSSMFGKAKFISAKLGIEWDPQIVWNAIPLSFLIDWVYPVGEALHRVRIPMIDINVTLLGQGFGAKTTIARTVYVRRWKRVESGLDYEFQPELDTLTAIRYDRYAAYVRIPIAAERCPEKLEFSKLTLRKALTGGALVWQVFLTPRRGR